jgi:anti-anti-sigma factor
MHITKQQVGQILELKIEGRLDGYWTDHLAAAVDEEIRQGSHHIQLDLSQVAFLSSAGIGMLVRFYKDLKSIQGSFVVSRCSTIARKALQLSKLEDVLFAKTTVDAAGNQNAPAAAAAQASSVPRQIEKPEALYEVYSLAAYSKLKCRVLGDASLLHGGGLTKERCRTKQFSDSTFAIGLGAPGENFEECQGRFGEFIAAGGAVAYLPTDGTNVPDFLLAQGTALPDVQVCYGIGCEGERAQPFSTLIRFEAKKGAAPVPMAALIESCMNISGIQQAGIVIIAESAGLMGAALRRSPALSGSQPGIFDFPAIRDWLHFTAERAHTKSVVLIAGISVRGNSGPLAPVVRPLSKSADSDPSLAGHFHAAAFSYRPLQRGHIDLRTSIKTLFERQLLQGVLHLLNDDRSTALGGQSELVRGACWLAPLAEINAEAA